MIYLHVITATKEEVQNLAESEKKLVVELRIALERLIEGNEGFGVPCSVLLWVLMMGRLCADGEDECWYQKRLWTTLETAGLGSWPDVRLFLKDLPWVKSPEDESLRRLCSAG